MILVLRPEDVRTEIDNLLREDTIARAEVTQRRAETRIRRQYNPRIATAPRIVASHAEQNINELRSDYTYFGKTADCLISSCERPAIQSHQASRRSQLKHIQSENGRVWWFDKFRNGYIGDGGPRVIDKRGVAVPQPSRVGAKNATYFEDCGLSNLQLRKTSDTEPSGITAKPTKTHTREWKSVVVR